MTVPIRLVVIGAGGRMGHSILRALPEYPQFELAAAAVATSDLAAALAGAARSGTALALDFSCAAATAANVDACVAARVPLLLGTTGYADGLTPVLELAAARIPLLVAANTSLAVAVLLGLVRRAAQALPVGFDIEIAEAHHRNKRDSPSGTALALGETVQSARGPTKIGYAVTRGGDLVGEHAVHFIGAGERLTLSHVATDRAVFARGALAAGAWLVGQAPGRYRMQDAIGEK